MASEVQRAIVYGSTATLTATLGSSANVGNVLVAIPFGAYATVNQSISGYTNLANFDYSGNDVGNVYFKTATGGETSVSAKYTASYSNALLFLELADVLTSTPAYNLAVQTWTLATHTMPSNSVAVPADGGYALGIFAIAGGSAGGGGSPTASNGFTMDSDSFQQVGYYSEFVCVHKIYNIAGAASTTIMLPNQNVATGAQLQGMVVFTSTAKPVIPFQPQYQRAAILAQ